MRKSSVKIKITLWYVLALTIVSFVVFFVMNSVTIKSIENGMSHKITRSVNIFSKRLTDNKGGLNHIRSFELFKDGVHMAIYDENGNLILGQNPFGISEDISFSGKVRENSVNGNRFFEYDKSIVVNNNLVWVKGMMAVGYETAAAKETAKYNLIFIVVMIFIAGMGGYLIILRTLSPVNRIKETAKSIIQSKDLKQRIRIGEGIDEFKSLANTFDDMLDEIEVLVEREKQFTSDASHELRTPVAVIMSECEYMENYASSADEFKESVASVKKQTERMSKLISELLTISRMDRDTVKLNFEETDLSELLKFICEEQVMIHSENITLTTDIEENVVCNVDKIMMGRLFINLISNAYQYNKENGEIKVSLFTENKKTIFSVSDTGIGIDEDKLPKIWERFYREDESRSENEENSMGLGLSMVKWIAEKHGGVIRVKTEKGKGFEFRVEI